MDFLFSYSQILTFFPLIVYVPCLVCFKRMSTAKFNEKGVLVDAGFDLNIGSGFSEYIQDLIIITGACQILATFSIYAWCLWLLVPMVGFDFLRTKCNLIPVKFIETCSNWF